MPESDVVRSCLDYLKIRGIFAWRQNAGVIPLANGGVRFSGLRGVSDILGILPDGRFLAVECKSAKGKTSEHQDAFLDQIAANGGVACVVRSVEELAEDLRVAARSAKGSKRPAPHRPKPGPA